MSAPRMTDRRTEHSSGHMFWLEFQQPVRALGRQLRQLQQRLAGFLLFLLQHQRNGEYFIGSRVLRIPSDDKIGLLFGFGVFLRSDVQASEAEPYIGPVRIELDRPLESRISAAPILE